MNWELPSRSPRPRGQAARFIAVASVVQLLSTAIAADVAAARMQRGHDAPTSAAAQEAVSPSPDEEALDLLFALERALQDNPEIQAARARLEAAGERPSQAGSLPDPMLSGVLRNVGFSGITIGDEMMSLAGIRFTQAMPYRGKRDLRAGVAERGIDVSAARLELIRRRVIREVAEAYFELDYVDRATGIVEETKAFLEQLEQTAEARYAVGEGIQQDVFKAQVEVSVLLNRLVVLDQRRDSVETALNRLLDQPVDTGLGMPGEVPLPEWDLELDDLEEQAIDGSAFLRERARRVEKRLAALDLARRDTKPDWLLSGAWMTRGELPDIWEVNVGITLPIYKGNKQDRAIVEAEAELRASQFDQRDSSGVVAAAVRDQFLRADRAARLIRLFRDAIIPQATLSLESAAAGYEVARVDFLTVLDNIVTLLTYQLEYHRQRADYQQSIARIEEHVGQSLGVTPASVFGGASERSEASVRLGGTPGGNR